MKIINHIVVFLIIIGFASCYNSVDQDLEYYNPVEGEWNIYSDSGTLLHKKVYTTNFHSYFLVIDGNIITNPDIQHYQVSSNNKLIFKRYTQIFRIDTDTLWITNSDGTQTSKYIRQKENIIQ